MTSVTLESYTTFLLGRRLEALLHSFGQGPALQANMTLHHVLIGRKHILYYGPLVVKQLLTNREVKFKFGSIPNCTLSALSVTDQIAANQQVRFRSPCDYLPFLFSLMRWIQELGLYKPCLPRNSSLLGSAADVDLP